LPADILGKPGGELAFIQALRALATHPAARGLNDDCAVLELVAETLILTHDMMAEGVHFLGLQDPADVAWKLVATNLSDLAGKGAQPLGVLLGYTLGAEDTRFVEGLAEALAAFDTPLLGGDTISSLGPRTFGLTALGRATHRPVPSRSGTRVGDRLWLTGAVGGAMLGLEALQAGNPDPEASRAYRRPEPLLAQGRTLAPHVTAMMDVSDGLLLDARRMAEASSCAATIELDAVPLSDAFIAERGHDLEARLFAATGGDDYALLAALAADLDPATLSLPQATRMTPIGSLEAGEPQLRLTSGGSPIALPERLGHEHCSNPASPVADRD